MKDTIVPTKTDLYRRFYAYHIPNAIAEGMATEIIRWIQNSGPEWTVKRLKALKTDFIQILAGNKPTSQWIKYYRGVPTGAFGRLFSYGLKHHKEPNRLARVLNALASYTAFTVSKETESQLNKFYGSVSSDPVDINLINEVASLMKPIARKLKVRGDTRLRTVKEYVPGPSKRCPSVEGKTVPDGKWFETTNCLWETKIGSNLWFNYSQFREACNPME
jgi:hypothetical protein